jgi:hypothetical protein
MMTMRSFGDPITRLAAPTNRPRPELPLSPLEMVDAVSRLRRRWIHRRRVLGGRSCSRRRTRAANVGRGGASRASRPVPGGPGLGREGPAGQGASAVPSFMARTSSACSRISTTTSMTRMMTGSVPQAGPGRAGRWFVRIEAEMDLALLQRLPGTVRIDVGWDTPAGCRAEFDFPGASG